MKTSEIIRIIIFSLIGLIVMFLLQPFFYRNRILRISDIDVEAWINNYYNPGGTIVFVVSVLSTIIWYLMTANAKAHRSKEVDQWMVVWWIFLLFPVLSICVAIGFFTGSNDTLVFLTIFFCVGHLITFLVANCNQYSWEFKVCSPSSIYLRRFFSE
jgi:hypothetical protein